MKNAVVYVRVSSEKQVDGYSLDSQEDLCVKKADHDGYKVLKIFREEGVSATTTKRPQLQEMLSFCRDKKNDVSAVFIYSISRLSRNTLDFLALKNVLAKSHVHLISITEPSSNDPEGDLIGTIMGAMAQYENQARARNVANSLKRRFLEGHITVKPPVGYKMIKENGKSTAVPDENFNVIKAMWYRAKTERLSYRAIAEELNKLGIKNTSNKRSKRFNATTIESMFKNPFYFGLLVSKKYGETIGKHEPMIDEETFYAVRAIMEGKRPNRGKGYVKLRDDFPLRGILKCAECGRNLSSAWSRGKLRKFAYYSCPSRGEHQIKSFSAEDIHKSYDELLKKVTFDPDFIQWFCEILKDIYVSKYELIKQSNKTIKNDIDNLKDLKKELGIKHLKGLYTDEDYLALKDDLEAQIAVKTSLLNEKKMQLLDIDTLLEWIAHYLSSLNEIWSIVSLEGKLKMGCSIFPRGLIWDKNKFRTPVLGDAYRLTDELSQVAVQTGEPGWIRTIDQLLKRQLLYR